MSQSEIQEIIEDRVDFMVNKGLEINQGVQMRHETVKIGLLPLKANNYEFYGENQTFNINFFHQLGWPDPFPNKIKDGKFVPLSDADSEKYVKSIQKINQKLLSEDNMFCSKKVDIINLFTIRRS